MTAPATAINTFSGSILDFADPDPAAVRLEDIAHGLSLAPRFGGQAAHFYSVAQHAVGVANTVERLGRDDLALAALHHDSHEAYACDIPKPLKRLLEPRYSEITAELDRAIAAALNFAQPSREDRALLRRADDAMLHVEAGVLLGDVPVAAPDGKALAAARWAARVEDQLWTSAQARARFTETHRRLALGPEQRRRPPQALATSTTTATGSSPGAASFPRSPLFSNHAYLLRLLRDDPRMSMGELADQLQVARRTVERAIADLEAVGLLSRERVGRRNNYTVNCDAAIGSANVGAVLDLLQP